jgi:short subunit dehydrogenase-like uncharacterized protein
MTGRSPVPTSCRAVLSCLAWLMPTPTPPWVPGRIVLYGATGYIGALTAQAMVASGVRPVLAGRDQRRLSALAARLSQAGDGTELETAVAAAEGPGPLRDLIGAGDVLVSTAGPFMKVGRPVVAAAVDAGAVYLDSSGEPPFIREVFEEFGPRAERPVRCC